MWVNRSTVSPFHTLKYCTCRFVLGFHPLWYRTFHRSYLPLWRKLIHLSISQSFVVETFTASLPFALTLIHIIILHVLDIVYLREGLSKSTIFVSKTMSMILAAIIIIFLLANAPGVIMNILTLCDIKIRFSWLTQIFWMLSNCSNSFVYVLFSKTTRTVFTNMFTCKYFRNEN